MWTPTLSPTRNAGICQSSLATPSFMQVILRRRIRPQLASTTTASLSPSSRSWPRSITIRLAKENRQQTGLHLREVQSNISLGLVGIGIVSDRGQTNGVPPHRRWRGTSSAAWCSLSLRCCVGSGPKWGLLGIGKCWQMLCPKRSGGGGYGSPV